MMQSSFLSMVASASEIARTPPMGWSSWNTFGKDINEQLVHQAVDAIVSSGMKDAGYAYVNIDDGWQLQGRDGNGNLQHDPRKFPGGMKALGDYIHSRGLKFGIYTSAGVQTCMRLEGSYDHEEQDVRQFVAWGVDFVKVDWCCTHPKHLADKDRMCPRNEKQDYGTTGQKELYQRWRTALSRVSRPLLLSICEWGMGKPWLWGPEIGNMWRTTVDILPCRSCRKSWWGLGWERILDQQVGLERYAGPGRWNDPDMLIVGVKDLADQDARSHFSFWCLLAAPLIAGNDPRSMSPEIRRILTNAEVIAVNQDTLGVQGRRIVKKALTEVWTKPLVNGAWAVILFNRSNQARKVGFGYRDLGSPPSVSYAIRDLWQGKELGRFGGEFQSAVPANDIVMMKMVPTSGSKTD